MREIIPLQPGSYAPANLRPCRVRRSAGAVDSRGACSHAAAAADVYAAAKIRPDEAGRIHCTEGGGARGEQRINTQVACAIRVDASAFHTLSPGQVMNEYVK